MKRLALIALSLFALIGCAGAADGIKDAGGNWGYVKGPHGENCLVYQSAVGTQQGIYAMSCDSVKP